MDVARRWDSISIVDFQDQKTRTFELYVHGSLERYLR